MRESSQYFMGKTISEPSWQWGQTMGDSFADFQVVRPTSLNDQMKVGSERGRVSRIASMNVRHQQ